jgi:RNA polymerase sigma factor (sigma-70 family)
MSTEIEAFHALMLRVRAGSQEAASELCRRYDSTLRLIVRHHLAQPVRRLIDSADIVEVAWITFFGGPYRTKQFDTPAHLIAFLTSLALSALANVNRDLRRRRRDLRRDRSLADPQTFAIAEGMHSKSTPLDVLATRDELDKVLADLPPKVREVLCLLRDGYSLEEVSTRLGVSTKTVSRMLARLRAAHQNQE